MKHSESAIVPKTIGTGSTQRKAEKGPLRAHHHGGERVHAVRVIAAELARALQPRPEQKPGFLRCPELQIRLHPLSKSGYTSSYKAPRLVC